MKNENMKDEKVAYTIINIVIMLVCLAGSVGAIILLFGDKFQWLYVAPLAIGIINGIAFQRLFKPYSLSTLFNRISNPCILSYAITQLLLIAKVKGWREYVNENSCNIIQEDKKDKK